MKHRGQELKAFLLPPESCAPAAALEEPMDQSPKEVIKTSGFDFNQVFDFEKFVESYGTTGFQATNLHEAIKIIREMRETRKDNPEYGSGSPYSPKTTCTVFLGYTSNMISCGNRDVIRYLVEHSHVDVLVTTAGGIEEDLIKCFAPTEVASFRLDGAELREKRLNRIGNLLVPSSSYEKFEDWLVPILDKFFEMQVKDGVSWTPSSIINYLGSKIDDQSSVCYWAHKNRIPVFCPAITDGAIGDIIYFYSIKKPGLKVDIVSDLTDINNIAKFSVKTGMVILGGGLIKHHVCNANLMRNGADYAIYINTAVEYDGSDAGAEPDEAVSWGKIRADSKHVKVFCDATIAFPLMVASAYRR